MSQVVKKLFRLSMFLPLIPNYISGYFLYSFGQLVIDSILLAYGVILKVWPTNQTNIYFKFSYPTPLNI
jgi:hypothetical protein